MKSLLVLFLLLLFILSSCCKDNISSAIIETDITGNITKGDTSLTYFKISELKKAGPYKNEFYLGTFGFIPKTQNCSATINIVVYPNPCPANITPTFVIKSNKDLINSWFWGDNSPSKTGGSISPTKRFSDIIGDNEGSKIYNFLVATSDSCAYELEWNLIRK
jgi:hypothetical protein